MLCVHLHNIAIFFRLIRQIADEYIYCGKGNAMRIVVISLLLMNFHSFIAMHDNSTIIPQASYFIFKGEEHNVPTGSVPTSPTKYVTFYSATGDELRTCTPEDYDFNHLTDLLDPQAPKPQPTSYKLVSHSGVKMLGLIRITGPGYYCVFKDMHGNYIRSYPYDKELKALRISFVPEQTIDVQHICELEDIDTSALKMQLELPEENEKQKEKCIVQ